MIKDCALETSGWPEPVSMRVLLSILYPVLSLTVFGLYPSMVSLSVGFAALVRFWDLWLEDAQKPRCARFYAKLHSKVTRLKAPLFTPSGTRLVGRDLPTENPAEGCCTCFYQQSSSTLNGNLNACRKPPQMWAKTSSIINFKTLFVCALCIFTATATIK